MPNSQRVIKIEIGQKLRFSIEDNLLELVIYILYFYEDSPKNKLSEISIQNIFEIPGLKNYQVGANEIRLPPELISTAFQSSIAHARALMAAHLFGTPLEFQLTSLVDGMQIAKYFYPHMFGGHH